MTNILTAITLKECDLLVSMHVNYSDMGGERHLALPDIPVNDTWRA